MIFFGGKRKNEAIIVTVYVEEKTKTYNEVEHGQYKLTPLFSKCKKVVDGGKSKMMQVNKGYN